MIKIYYLIFPLFFCFACSQKVDKPKDILSKYKMVAILIDIHIAEAEIIEKQYVHGDDSANVAYQKDEKKIFKKHKIDSLTYNRSFNYYAQNMNLLDEIYGIVVDSLSYRETLALRSDSKGDSLNKLKEKERNEPAIVDSLRKNRKDKFQKLKKEKLKQVRNSKLQPANSQN